MIFPKPLISSLKSSTSLPRLATVLCCLVPLAAAAQQPADARAEQEVLQRDAAQSQARIDNLDDETMSMVSAYNRELERYEELQSYNENLRQLLDSQRIERERIDAELQEVEVVRQAIVPLMVEMVDVLERFIALDQPMLVDERTARSHQLKSIVTRSDVEIAEKYRRIIEAYLIEAEYGQSLEAYEAQAIVNGNEITVDYLRVGRVGLFYVTLDRRQAGIWNSETGDWLALPMEHLDSLDYALRVAREQAPPNLLTLPLWSGGVNE